MGSAGQDSVPDVVPVLCTLQAAEQCSKFSLVNQPIVQSDGNLDFVKGVIDCAHQGCTLYSQLKQIRMQCIFQNQVSAKTVCHVQDVAAPQQL